MFSNGTGCGLIGVIHLLPLPGAADYAGSMKEVMERALSDALIYKEVGFDALIVENTHDAPYLRGAVGPETVAATTLAASALKEATGLPLGVQILAGANIEALAVAAVVDLDFIRVEGFVYAHVGDEGTHEACAGELLRRRFHLAAQRVKIFADIKKKHSSHALTSDVSIAQTAKDAQYCRADGVIVTGVTTGSQPSLPDVEAVSAAVDISVLIGSGITAENLKTYARLVDAVIVGSSAKAGGLWSNPVDREAALRLVEARSCI